MTHFWQFIALKGQYREIRTNTQTDDVTSFKRSPLGVAFIFHYISLSFSPYFIGDWKPIPNARDICTFNYCIRSTKFPAKFFLLCSSLRLKVLNLKHCSSIYPSENDLNYFPSTLKSLERIIDFHNNKAWLDPGRDQLLFLKRKQLKAASQQYTLRPFGQNSLEFLLYIINREIRTRK